MKKIIAIMAAGLAAILLVACSVLPEEQAASEPTDAEGPQMTAEEARASFINDYTLRKLSDMLFQLPPIPTNAELERMEAERLRATPYQNAEQALIDFCRVQADNAVKQFFADYPTENYEARKDERILSCIYDGRSGREVNGGLTPLTIGQDTGYWRVTDCEYYSTVFYSNGESNAPRVLYRCNVYHYVLNGGGNLAEAVDDSVLTAENSTVKEYPNMFLVVSLKDVCPNDTLDPAIGVEKILPEVLAFENYDDMMSSFMSPMHSFSDLYIPKDSTGNVVNGYTSQPIVAMPALVGRYIDVSQPDKVQELEAIGVKNYVVKWVENDGSLVPYSIQATSLEEGTVIDITDMSRDAQIVVEVAEKPVVEAAAEEPEPEAAPEEAPDAPAEEG